MGASDENGNLLGTSFPIENPLYTPSSFSSGIAEDQVVTMTMTAYATPCTENITQSQSNFNSSPKVNNIETLWGTASVCAGEDDLYTTEIADIIHYESYQWDSQDLVSGLIETQLALYRPSQDEADAGQFTLTLAVGGQEYVNRL